MKGVLRAAYLVSIRRPDDREMRDLLKLLRESLPEIIGGLAVAGLLAAIGTLYAGLGIWPTVFIIVLIAVLVGGLGIVLARRRADVSQQSLTETETTSRESTQETHYDESTPGRNQSILFVDDDIEIIGASFIRLLQKEGFDVVVATTASQALKILESDQPIDLAIVDLMMPPGEDFNGKVGNYDYGRLMGLAVFEKIRELRGNIPAICFSVVRDPDVVHKVKRLGAVALLSKPILPSELVEQIELALVRANAPSEAELVHEEIERRKLELESSHASSRLRAVWALGEIGHHDATLLSRLDKIGKEDKDAEVRAAAKHAAKKVRRKLRQGRRPAD